MKTGFIGAGKVGFSLGRLFAENGIPLTGYYSRQRESAEEAANFTGTHAYSDLCELVQDSDAIFLTVPDRTITSVYLELRSFSLSGKQICHCSGALSAREAFPGLAENGALGLSIHPLFPVSSRYDSYRELADAFCCLEGEKQAVSAWKPLLERCGCTVQTISAEGKPLYHAACATASNLVCALVQQSIDQLTRCGFDEQSALRALTPLIRSNTARLLEVGPCEALTGPVERNDCETVKKHLACIPEGRERALYTAATRNLIELAVRRHPGEDYGAMRELTEEGHK